METGIINVFDMFKKVEEKMMMIEIEDMEKDLNGTFRPEK